MDQVSKQSRSPGGTSILKQQQNYNHMPGQQVNTGGRSNPQFNVKAASRKQHNGGESNVVKSLLTGQKYVQQSSGRSQKITNKQPVINQTEEISSNQQDVLMANIPADLAPGEKILAFLDGVAYEITAGENNEFIAKPTTDQFPNPTSGGMVNLGNSNISLEDLANISAEQENVKIGEGTNSTISMITGGDQLSQQQLLGNHQIVATGDDPNSMQIIIMPSDNNNNQSIPGNQTIKMNGGSNDLVIQPGQPIPPELQEIITKGNISGLDLNNYEFVIQEDNSASEHQNQAQQVFVTTGANGQIDPQTLQEFLQQNQQPAYIASNNDVLALLAEASSAVAQSESSGLTYKTGFLMAPEDEDDGEFSHLKEIEEDEEDSKLVGSDLRFSFPNDQGHQPKSSYIYDAYSQAFSSFVQGNKPETLASVANSAILKKPPLPPYIPEFCPVRRLKGQSSNSMLASRAPNKKRFDYDNRGFPKKEKKNMISRIINRKSRGSDDDSFDELDFEEEQMMSDSDASDPGWRPPMDSARKAQQQLMALNSVKTTRGSRGRGRPRGSRANSLSGRGGLAKDERGLQSSGFFTGSMFSAAPNEPHFYQKGDFVLERKDFYKKENFPIWKIEAGRLLQKFDPVTVDGKLLHKSASIYSSWSGDIRSSFKAILVEVINTNGRRQEMVKIIDEYLPKPFDESLEQDALIDLFNIYVQNLLSQSLDPSFMNAIRHQQEEYYLGPLRQIDSLLVEAEQTITSQISWNQKFKEVLDQFPYYKLMEVASHERYACQASLKSNSIAVKVVNFFGPFYNGETLESNDEVDSSVSDNFMIGQTTLDLFPTYHALHHFKYLLYKSSNEEVTYRRIQAKDKADEVILAECLQNRVWVQQHLRFLKDLLQKCSIVITVVTRGEDDQQNMETETGQVTSEAPNPSTSSQPVTTSAAESADVSITTTAALETGVTDLNIKVETSQQQQQQQQLTEQQQQQQQQQTNEQIQQTAEEQQQQLLQQQLLEQQILQQQQQLPSTSGLTLMQVDANGNLVQLDPNSSAASAGTATVVLGGSGELEAANGGAFAGQTLSLVQLEDGSIVQAVYDPSMVSLLEQQQQQQQQLEGESQQQQQQQQQQLIAGDQQQEQQLGELSLEQQQILLEQQLLIQQQQQQQLEEKQNEKEEVEGENAETSTHVTQSNPMTLDQEQQQNSSDQQQSEQLNQDINTQETNQSEDQQQQLFLIEQQKEQNETEQQLNDSQQLKESQQIETQLLKQQQETQQQQQVEKQQENISQQEQQQQQEGGGGEREDEGQQKDFLVSSENVSVEPSNDDNQLFS